VNGAHGTAAAAARQPVAASESEGSSEEQAQNGHGLERAARRISEFPCSLAARIRALCASGAREKRIAELRRQYVEGTYRVDAAQVSASIIDDHLED
jgi:anti-sigma28 factor (negative regulator of flagellin synthesis)